MDQYNLKAVTYKASLDSFAKVLTTFILSVPLLLPVILAVIDSVGEPFPAGYLFIALPVSAIIGSLIFLGYTLAPRSYTITEDSLIINRRINPPVFNLPDIVEVKLLEEDGYMPYRRFASNGIFGYFGKYRHLLHGKVTMYATRIPSNMILITLRNQEKIIITPDSLEMLHELKKRVHLTAT